MGKFGTGQAIRRTEDQRLITGNGRYTDDIVTPEAAHLYLLRSPYAHGAITSIDAEEAKSAPGVIAIYTADDLTAAGILDVAGSEMPASSVTDAKPALQQPPLARDKVRYVGEPVVAILADSVAAAKDAAELIFLDIEELDAVVTMPDARSAGAPDIHANVPGNSYGIREYGSRIETESAFASATHIVEIDIVNNRLAPTAMEPRGCIMQFDGKTLTVYQGCQSVHVLRDRLSQSINLDPADIHFLSPDVGGAFGLKFFLQCEPVVAAFAAMQSGRPVRWMADRTESFLSDLHGRDHLTRGAIALDDNGKVQAMRVSIQANLGAYSSQAGAAIPWFGACMTTGCYAIDTAYVDVEMVVTNTVPVDAYRGAGRPEAAYLVERLMDKAARQLGLSRDEIRRRNFIRPDQFPYETPTGRAYDSGEYERLMDAAIERADWSGFESRKQESISRGRLRGIGMSYYVEICSALGGENTYVRFEQNGRISILMGTQASGQGHETSYAQMVAAELGIELDAIDVIQGDSRVVPTGEGTGGSRSMAIGGSSLYRSIGSMIDSGKVVAADLLEAATVDIEFDDGHFRIIGTDRAVSLQDVGAASWDDAKRPVGVEPGLYSSERFQPEAGTFPNGCHICELEVDPETGVTEILRYVVEDDVGVVVNPLILEGQIMGGIAQGLGQACCEDAIYESETGQLQTATFMDYTMPRADWVPDVEFRYQEVPSPRNPLGIKGAGEAGTVGAAPAYINALIDALSVTGIDHIDMPATPHRVWQALQSTKA